MLLGMLMFLCGMSSALIAHEVTPSIADIEHHGSSIELELRINAEAFVARIDLDGLSDTDQAEGDGRYDTLRALVPSRLVPLVHEQASNWRDRLVTQSGEPVALRLASVEIGPVGNPDQPRVTTVRFKAEVSGPIMLHWPKGAGALIVRQQGIEDAYTALLQGGDSSAEISSAGSPQSGWLAFATYIPVGFDHILPKGLDHILFVLGLFFLSTRLGPLIWQVSAFTLAHTVTLALGAMGYVQVPAQIVEPLIAASITFVAVENILAKGLTPWRPVVVFGFGLLHGLGFASVLGEFGLPDGQFIPALIGFNIGVELGQLTVIALAFLAVGYWFGARPWYRARIAVPASVIIGLIGAYWFVERVFLT
jgi:hypothetical protein